MARAHGSNNPGPRRQHERRPRGRMLPPTAAPPATQLASFIAKFSPADQRLIRSIRAAMRRRFPTAFELVWDNYNFFVIGYGPTERPSEAIASIAARAGAVSLCFVQGAKLPDPAGILVGSGNQVRSIRLESAATLERPEVEALLVEAARRAKPFAASGRGRLIIRGISPKQRPRQR